MTKWSSLLPTVCNILYEIDSELFNSIVSGNVIHKATSKQSYDMKDPILSYDSSLVVEPVKMDNADIYVEGCISSDRARFYTKQILDLYGLSDVFKICVN